MKDYAAFICHLALMKKHSVVKRCGSDLSKTARKGGFAMRRVGRGRRGARAVPVCAHGPVKGRPKKPREAA